MFEIREIVNTLTGRILLTVAILVLIYLMRIVIYTIINRRTTELHRRIVNKQLASYVLWIFALAFVIPIWLPYLQDVFAVVSVIAVAIVLVTRDVLVNLLAHAIIVWRALFSVGDRIQIQGYIGDVVQIGPLYLTLAEFGSDENDGEPTGRIIKLPNNIILTTPLANYTRGIAVIWTELKIELALESNWNKALEILQRIGEQHSARIDENDYDTIVVSVGEALYSHSSPSTSIKVYDGRYELRLRYSCRLDNRRETERTIWTDVLNAFAKEGDITLYQ